MFICVCVSARVESYSCSTINEVQVASKSFYRLLVRVFCIAVTGFAKSCFVQVTGMVSQIIDGFLWQAFFGPDNLLSRSNY